VIVQRPPERHTVPWPPRNANDAYDITRAEAETVRQQLAGKPVSVFHRDLDTAVGTIDRGYWDARGNLCVEFTLNGSSTALIMAHDILEGLKRGLSLQHNWRTLEVKEVSLTDIGAREGTWIEQMQLPGDKHEFVALPSRPRPSGMSEIPRDPATGQFMSATPASGAPAANTGVAPMDTGPAPPQRDGAQQQQQAPAAAAGSEGPVDPLLAIISNESIPVEQRKQLIENFKAQRAQALMATQQLQEAQAKLAESKKQEQNMMGVYMDTVSRLVHMGGQDLKTVAPRAEQAAANNDLAGFAAATAEVMVKASGTIEKLLESRKRAVEQSITTDKLLEDYNQFNAALRHPPSSNAAAAAAAAMGGQQQQQQQFAPAMVAASGPYGGRAPQQQYAPPPQQQQQPSQYRDGRALLPPELHAAWAGYMATQDTTVDVGGMLERANAVMTRGM